MRLEKLTIRGIGPFKGEATLDLRNVDHKIIAITGANGAGKSTTLELFPAALYRECPTRGSLASLATRRDAFVEAQVVNGERFTVRQLVDGVSGKGETVLLDENGQAINASGKLREADAWIARHILPPEVVYASIFAHQGNAGFIRLKSADRKKVLLRVLGIERLEAMAEKARERARFAKEDLRLIEVRQADEKARGVSVDVAEAGLHQAKTASAEADAALVAARERLQVLRDEVAAIEEARRAWDAARVTFDGLSERILNLSGRRGDLLKRLDNNRGVLARAEEIRAAVARAAELDLLIRDAETLDNQRVQAISAADAAWRTARSHVEAAGQRLEDAKRSKKSAEDMARILRPKVEEARAALPEAVEHARLNREAYEGACRSLERLQGQQTATADERIQALRGALDDIILDDRHDDADELGRVKDVASGALSTDDWRVAQAAALPGKVAEAKAFQRETWAAVAQADEKVQRLQQALAREDDLARLDAEATHWDSRIGPAQQALDEARDHEDNRRIEVETLCEQPPLDASDAKANRAALEPVLKLVGPLAQAEARIAELETQLSQVEADLADVETERAAMVLPPPPRVTPHTGVAEEEVRRFERAAMNASNAVALAQKSVEDAVARAAKLAELDTERTEIVGRLADWTRLANDLGKDGIQALEIDAAGPELSALVNDMLHTCHGSRFTVSVETTRLDAKGKRQLEGCEVMVVDTVAGREGPVETFSGGESVIIGEAIALALSVLACRHAGIERPTLVRDESGAALDPANGRAYVAMLRRAAEMVDADKVLFVSHAPELQELADARIVVADGGLTLEG